MRPSVKLAIAVLSGLAVFQIYTNITAVMTVKYAPTTSVAVWRDAKGSDGDGIIANWTSALPASLRQVYDETVQAIKQRLSSVSVKDASMVWGAAVRRVSVDLLIRETAEAKVTPSAPKTKDKVSAAVGLPEQKRNVSAVQSTLSLLQANHSLQNILSYLYKNNAPENSSNLPPCPNRPPGLVGLQKSNQTEPGLQELTEKYFFLQPGGHYSPPECQARQKVAILIPYRNRWSHLHILLNNLLPFLMRQQVDFTIFVIEQEPPTTFNRALLLNVGFLESLKRGNYTCFILHDVDLIPLHDENIYRCGSNPVHMAAGINKFKYGLPYSGYFGGIVAMTREQLMAINGNSNLFFGWGGEDDDLLARVKNKGMKIRRYPTLIARYDMIKHTLDTGNEVNPVRTNLLASSAKRIPVDGLSTLKYNLSSIEYKPLYTWMRVSVNQTEIMQNAPDYVQAILRKEAIRKELERRKAELRKHLGANASLAVADVMALARARQASGQVPPQPANVVA